MKKSELVELVKELENRIRVLEKAVAAQGDSIQPIPYEPFKPWGTQPYITWKDTTHPFVDPNTTID